ELFYILDLLGQFWSEILTLNLQFNRHFLFKTQSAFGLTLSLIYLAVLLCSAFGLRFIYQRYKAR
ncbi:MAG: hypothetical protein OEY59_11105, partial [Deltaproteobacteria bacterium]|nr:hypothetical protein [Deltaproteobacteria bacterium]